MHAPRDLGGWVGSYTRKEHDMDIDTGARGIDSYRYRLPPTTTRRRHIGAMGCGASMSASSHSEASVVVSAGPNTLHACFMVCLKVDLYQPKYANIPITFSVTPCQPGQAFVGGYGVGTVFTGINGGGVEDSTTLVEVEPLARIVATVSGIRVTYTTTALTNGDCKLGMAFDGPNMGLFKNHLAMQLNTMKSFIEVNVAAICSDAPPLGSVSYTTPVGGETPAATMTVDAVCDWAAAQGLDSGPFREHAIDGKLLLQMDHAMLEELGVSSKIKRTKLLGAIADLQPQSPGSASGGFVEVPQHAQAVQTAQNMFQVSQTQAITTAINRANLNQHPY